jgi:hypothetical protein
VSRPESLKRKGAAARRLSLPVPIAGLGAELQAEDQEESETEGILLTAKKSA